jgi:DNA-binding NarL/FixJ family response regulator
MIRVVVADDQALVRGGIRMILETQADIASREKRPTATGQSRCRASSRQTSS